MVADELVTEKDFRSRRRLYRTITGVRAIRADRVEGNLGFEYAIAQADGAERLEIRSVITALNLKRHHTAIRQGGPHQTQRARRVIRQHCHRGCFTVEHFEPAGNDGGHRFFDRRFIHATVADHDPLPGMRHRRIFGAKTEHAIVRLIGRVGVAVEAGGQDTLENAAARRGLPKLHGFDIATELRSRRHCARLEHAALLARRSESDFQRLPFEQRQQLFAVFSENLEPAILSRGGCDRRRPIAVEKVVRDAHHLAR